ncbi:MAG TPA: FAD:protein FMN transferase [Brevundimonas sp.]|nr:FAD:protein FMN transferase [Brevundimonas sp.]
MPTSGLVWDFAGETMGTSWAVRLVPPPALDRAVLQAAVEEELAQVVALFSHWNPRSELSRFNAAPPGFWQVSEPFWTFLDAAMNLADETDGAVDPTLGALVDLWGFGPPGPRPLNAFGAGPDLPLDDEIAAALAVSGWGRLRLNRQARAVQQPGGLKLDFSGIAKGHAVDCVSGRLTALGARHHLVEIGGELRGAGVKPGRHPWWVDLQQVPGAPGPRTAAALFDMAVATSGDWVRRFDLHGQSFSHTIDGRTGRPIANGMASVTVLADTALYADAMATALTVMGPVDGAAYAEALGIAAAFVMRGEDGLQETVSPAFAAMAAEGA